jgi:hypothetical protein
MRLDERHVAVLSKLLRCGTHLAPDDIASAGNVISLAAVNWTQTQLCEA